MTVKELRGGDLIDFMLITVTNAFKGKKDKGGKPYIFHCLAVMNLMNSDDDIDNAIALGHDLFEDTSVTAKYLRENGVPEEVIEGIYALTKMPGEDYEEYKAKVKGNIRSVRVKKRDLTHNSDIRRLKGVREKDIERVARYMLFYSELEQITKE